MCWISVNDQLPDDCEHVDVWVVDREASDVCGRIADVPFETMEFRLPEFVEWIDIELAEVTHWRYPPASPTGAASA